MSFRVSARTILQLGAELISSDSIAFYELIKNAFDAGSKRVDIDIVVRMKHDKCVAHIERIDEEHNKNRIGGNKSRTVDKFKDSLLNDVDSSAPHATAYKNRIKKAETWARLKTILEAANYIIIEDTGCGMSLNDLEYVYLTIGTRSQYKKRKEQLELFASSIDKRSDSRPILGEKGIGRLSAMRLGTRLRVKTSTKGESHWNTLDIDWSKFSHESDDLIEDVKINPETGSKKENFEDSGTRIRISALSSAWSGGKVKEVARDSFSKLTDPFSPTKRYCISLRYNNDPVNIPPFDKLIFQHAHAIVEAEFMVDKGEPRFSGHVNYLLRNKEITFSLEGEHLLSTSEAPSISTLKSLGPFKVILYWYNRQLLRAIDGVGDKMSVHRWIANWAGGLMLFKDGFRVNPYGNQDDDWLDLDKKALAAQGYKVNRRQLIGKVDISSFNNPKLYEQTNREGLSDCPEKRALVSMLKHLLEDQFREFLNIVDKEFQKPFESINKRITAEQDQVRNSLLLLYKKYPKVKEDQEVTKRFDSSLKQITKLMGEVKQLSDSYKQEYQKMVHLAGEGMMVEILAHELNRATLHALNTIGELSEKGIENEIAGYFETLEAQLKTLQKRLRILDPLSTAGRQRKEKFDLIYWVEDIVEMHKAQFARHNIKCILEIEPSANTSTYKVKMVKGMVVQILENLMSNSVYWLKQRRNRIEKFSPEISITIDTEEKMIKVWDNGPGVAVERKEIIFQPFETTKPPGLGKGLGLYISREIAKYHNVTLNMSDEVSGDDGYLNTFVLCFQETNL